MNPMGLSSTKAHELKQQYGDNLLPTKEKTTWVTILIGQFKNPLVLLLVVVGLLSLYFKEVLDASLIGLVILFNITTGFIQEYSAHKTLTALKKIITLKSFVVRDGKRMEIETKDLVPGDVVIISSGDRVPADGKIIQGESILVNEAILTGEEEEVVKSNLVNNGLFMGTTIIAGQGIMIVENIGTHTKMGSIGKSLSEIKEEDTPLQKKLTELSKSLIGIVVAISIVIFITGILEGGDVWQTIRMAIVLSIAAIPEGLPIAVTVILAIGMRRILKRKGLVKKLLSIETLGSTSVICLDKTGTITEGKMQVVQTEYKDKERFLLALTLLNDRKAAMEAAIWNFLKKESSKNPDTVYNAFEKVSDEPFDSAKKYKAVINLVDGKKIAFVMGAPEIIMNFCSMQTLQKKALLAQFEAWATKGLRILGVATKQGGNLLEKKGFTWLGLVGVEDPVRKEAHQALQEAQEAGIAIKIVTGDYRLTAEQVVKKIGMTLTSKNVLGAEELDALTDEQLTRRIDTIHLFTRVTPLQKLRIIRVLQEKGEVVAMTGDGVNDAPAVKKADIGIVVENGTDVAKEAADLILLDSNFQTIMNACEEGRLILSNIKKVIGYVLSNSFAEITLIFGAMLLKLPVPLTVAQILWIHLICDGPPDIMLGFEPKEKGIMRLNPKELSKENIFSTKMKSIVFVVSLTIGLSCLMIFRHLIALSNDIDLTRTIIFAILGVVSLVYIFSFKNLHRSIIHTDNLFENKYLLASVVYGFILVFLAVYVPALNTILHTVPLQASHWVIVGLVALAVTMVIELFKIVPNVIKHRTSTK